MRRILNGFTLAGATVVLVLAAQATAARTATTVSSVYTVGSTTVPGVDTGLLLRKGRSLTVTATGTVCPGTGYCVDPNGYPSVDTTQSGFGGFVLPGAPAYGLVGRVGDGPWEQVGSGQTTLSGSGDLVFAVNDDLFGDNTGSFTVTVSYSRGSASRVSSPTSSCYPGWGHGDSNHEHSGPPGRNVGACRPGWGYGDANHEHSGPPGRQESEQPSANAHGSSSEHGNSSAKGG